MKQIIKLVFALTGATLLSANALAVPELTNYDVNGDNVILEGEQAYKLVDADDLYWFAGLVNGTLEGVKQDIAANAYLAENITVNADVLNKNGKLNDGPFEEWVPIGSANIKYKGTFDGNGKTISGLYFNNKQDYVGLFGYIGEGATIKNLGVIDSYINGYNYIGSVCGYNYGGIIENCYNASNENGDIWNAGVCGYNDKGTIANCYNVGSVKSTGGDGSRFIGNGGVCGYNNDGTIENCYNAGDVNGKYHTGGVCGSNHNSGTIKNCYNVGSVKGDAICTGGVCGHNEASIINSYNIGSVSGVRVGGVCGHNNATITNCYNTGNVSGSKYVGGLCGWHEFGYIKNCFSVRTSVKDIGIGERGKGTFTNVTVLPAECFANGMVARLLHAYDIGLSEANKIGSDVWGQRIGIDDTPTLCGEIEKRSLTKINEENRTDFNLSASYIGYYAISNADELYMFEFLVASSKSDATSAKAVLVNDIVVNEDLLLSIEYDGKGNVTNGDKFRKWLPIVGYVELQGYSTYFSGTFDGNGKTISGLYFNNQNQGYVGLFGYNKRGTIKNVGIIDSYFKGGKYIASVCGYNDNGTIENCYTTSSVSGTSYRSIACGNSPIKNCYDFKLNGGTMGEYSIVVDDGNIALPTNENISLEDYTLEGWCVNEDLSDDAIESEEANFDVHTLYAKWVEPIAPTAIKSVKAENDGKTIKTIKDGQIVIIRNGVMYDMQGRKL